MSSSLSALKVEFHKNVEHSKRDTGETMLTAFCLLPSSILIDEATSLSHTSALIVNVKVSVYGKKKAFWSWLN